VSVDRKALAALPLRYGFSGGSIALIFLARNDCSLVNFISGLFAGYL
jgi:hypothetical protein